MTLSVHTVSQGIRRIHARDLAVSITFRNWKGRVIETSAVISNIDLAPSIAGKSIRILKLLANPRYPFLAERKTFTSR